MYSTETSLRNQPLMTKSAFIVSHLTKNHKKSEVKDPRITEHIDSRSKKKSLK